MRTGGQTLLLNVTHKMHYAGCNKYIRTKKNVINNDRLGNFYSVYPAINKIYLILERYIVLNLNIIRTELLLSRSYLLGGKLIVSNRFSLKDNL